MAGKAVVNLGFGIKHYYRNYFKACYTFAASGGSFILQDYFDSNNYPDADLPFNVLLNCPTDDVRLAYSGNWVLKWTGKLGGMQISPDTVQSAGFPGISGNAFVTATNGNFWFKVGGTNGRVVFRFSTPVNVVQFFYLSGALGWDGTLTNMVFCREADEAAIDAGTPFRTEAIDYLNTLGDITLRFLNWTDVNNAKNVAYANRPTSSLAFYKAGYTPQGIWAGTLTGNQDYTVAAAPDTPGTWTHGEQIIAYVSSTNTGSNPTLDIGSRGPKTIVNCLHAAGSVGTNKVLAASDIPVGVNNFTYDSLIGQVVWQGAGALGGGVVASVPYEECVALCNATSSDCWICIPHLASDAYVASLITLIRTNLNSGLKLYIEFSNETWNYAFIQTSWNLAQATALNLRPSNVFEGQFGHVGKRVREVMEIATDNWSPRTSTELVRVMAVQGGGSPTPNQTFKFDGTDLGAYGFNVAPDRPIDYCDAIAIAAYISGAQVNYSSNYANTMTDALDAADDYDSGTASRMEAALDWLDTDIRAGTRNGSLGGLTLQNWFDTLIAAWNTSAGTYSKDLIGYEGSLEIYPPTTTIMTSLGHSTDYAAKFAALILAYKSSSRARRLVASYLYRFAALSNAGIPAVYTEIGDDAWAMRLNFYDDGYGMEDGLIDFTHGIRQFRTTTS